MKHSYKLGAVFNEYFLRVKRKHNEQLRYCLMAKEWGKERYDFLHHRLCSGGIRQFKNFNRYLLWDHRRRVILSGIGTAADVQYTFFKFYAVIIFFIL